MNPPTIDGMEPPDGDENEQRTELIQPDLPKLGPGRVLADRYELTNHIARGGMADVWEARDSLLNRRVAVKILHAQFSEDESFIKRFRREAQAAANLSHPNIVSIFDWGEEGSVYFIVMEIIDGRPLRDVIRSDGHLLPRRAAEIAAETAAALAVSHRGGLIHRDVKPANILLASDGTVKVTDFGIARAWDDSQELTKTGAVIGTATYFSPEQAQGEPADERSDIYSLGVVLYEMLVGTPPFKGESPVSVAYQHVQEPALIPSIDNPDIPEDLERIVMRAMDKVPENRYQTALELREDLLRNLRGVAPLAAAPPLADAPTEVMTQMPAPTVAPEETYRQVAAEERDSYMPFWVTVAVLVASLVALLFVLGRGFAGDDPVEVPVFSVPPVVGQTQADAVLAIQDAGFLVGLDSTTSNEWPAGIVVATDPEGGTELAEGARVTVIVSLGPDSVSVPNVVGMTEAEARATLEAAEFVVGENLSEASADVPEGSVIRQSPAADSAQPPNSTVSLTISTGPGVVLLENLRGRPQADSEAILANLGLEVTVTEEFDPTVPVGFVTRTEPGAGEVPAGSAVTLFVSKGPALTGVPSLIGKTEQEARDLLTAAGFLIAVSPDLIDAGEDFAGKVAEQNPSAGIEMAPGSTVTVFLGSTPVTTTTTTTSTTTTTTTSSTTSSTTTTTLGG